MSIKNKAADFLELENPGYHGLAMVAGILFLSCSIPLDDKINVIAMISFGALWIIYQAFSREILCSAFDFKMLLLPALLLIPASGLFWTYHVDETWKSIEKEVSFAGFPFAFWTIRSLLSAKVIRLTAYAFILPVIFAGVHYVVSFYSLPTYTQDDIHLLNELSLYNRTYLSMHLAFTILFLFMEAVRVKGSKLMLGVVLVLLVLSVMSIITIASRMGIVELVVGVFVLLVMRASSISKRKRILAFSVFLLLIVSAGAFVPSLRGRVMDIVEGGLTYDPKNANAQTQSGLNLRLIKWTCATEIISEHPLRGVTVGDAKYHLNDCYRSKRFWGHNMSFNAHNQYLHYGLSFGIPGILIFLLVLFVPMRLAIQHRNMMLLLLMVIIVIASLTEVVLARQKAIMFFSLFFVLGMLPHLKNREKKGTTD